MAEWKREGRAPGQAVRIAQSGLLALGLLLAPPVLADGDISAEELMAETQATRPAAVPADLRAATDPLLQRALQRYVERLGLMRAVERERLALALVDVTDHRHPRLAMLNGNTMLYAASLPKIAILFGAFHKAAEGKLRIDGHLRAQMTEMIRHSSNTAATYVLDQVGRNYLTGVLRSDRYRLYDVSRNGGLWVGKAYASGGAYQRDPLHNLSHGATAYQVARFYYLLETGQLVSREASRQMKEILGEPAIQHKFVAGLREVVPHAQIYRKSGTWREHHADSAIIEHDGRRYIAVALAEDARGGEWLRQLIVAMDRIVFSQPDRAVVRAAAQ